MTGVPPHSRVWLIRILSLLLAVVIWLFVDLEQQDETQLAGRIQLENIPPGLAVSSGQLPEVRVRVSGPKILLIRHQGFTPVIPLECGGVREGFTRFAGIEKGVRAPGGIVVERVSPATIDVKFQKRDKGGK